MGGTPVQTRTTTMKTLLLIPLLAAGAFAVQDGPPEAKPQEPHKWLQQLVGEWTVSSEMSMGGATWKMESTEKVRAIGGLWTMAEGNLNIGGMSVTAILTLGFDPRQDLFVGTYVDSTTPYLWSYIGTLDKSGKVLTLDTKGPAFNDPEEMARYREVITIKSADVRTFSSSIEDGKGGWTTFMTAESRRKK